jgi:PD-(D/E)XK endonuclease
VEASKLRLPKPQLTAHPVDVGLRSEAAILSELVRRGCAVLLPFGVNQRYDLVLDIDGELVKVQCKTGRLRHGAINFSTRSVTTTKRRNVHPGVFGRGGCLSRFLSADSQDLRRTSRRRARDRNVPPCRRMSE